MHFPHLFSPRSGKVRHWNLTEADIRGVNLGSVSVAAVQLFGCYDETYGIQRQIHSFHHEGTSLPEHKLNSSSLPSSGAPLIFPFKCCILGISWQSYLYFPSRILVLFCHFYFEKSCPDCSPRTACCFLSLFSSRPCDRQLDVKYPFLIWQFYGACMHSPWILSKTSLSGDISKLILLICVAWLFSCAFRLHTLPLRTTTIRLLSRPFLLMSCS